MRPSDSLLNDWIIGGRRRKNQKSASKKLDGFAVRTNSVVPILSLGPWTVVTSPSPNYLSSIKKHPAGPPPSESSCMTVAAGNVEGCPSLILSAGRAGPRLAKCFHPRQWQMRPSSGRWFWSHRPKSKKWPPVRDPIHIWNTRSIGIGWYLIYSVCLKIWNPRNTQIHWLIIIFTAKMVINWGPIPCSSNPHHISHVRWLWIPKCCWLYRYYQFYPQDLLASHMVRRWPSSCNSQDQKNVVETSGIPLQSRGKRREVQNLILNVNPGLINHIN